MAVEIRREVTPHFSLTCASTAATGAGRFPYGPFAGGLVYIDAVSGATAIEWHAARTQDDTGVKVYVDGSALTTAATVGAHPIPDALFGAQFVVPIAINATTGMNITVGLKG